MESTNKYYLDAAFDCLDGSWGKEEFRSVSRWKLRPGAPKYYLNFALQLSPGLYGVWVACSKYEGGGGTPGPGPAGAEREEGRNLLEAAQTFLIVFCMTRLISWATCPGVCAG